MTENSYHFNMVPTTSLMLGLLEKKKCSWLTCSQLCMISLISASVLNHVLREFKHTIITTCKIERICRMWKALKTQFCNLMMRVCKSCSNNISQMCKTVMFGPGWRFQVVLNQIKICFAIGSDSSGNVMFQGWTLTVWEEHEYQFFSQWVVWNFGFSKGRMLPFLSGLAESNVPNTWLPWLFAISFSFIMS